MTAPRVLARHWDLLVTCPRCGSLLELVAPGRPTDRRTRLATVVRCPECPTSNRHVGHGRMVESSKALPAWRDTVAWAARQAMGSRPTILTPVGVVIGFYFQMPKSACKTDREQGKVLRPRKPDIDKLSRAILDALTDAGVIADDSQVVMLAATKCDAVENPGAHVVVSDV